MSEQATDKLDKIASKAKQIWLARGEVNELSEGNYPLLCSVFVFVFVLKNNI